MREVKICPSCNGEMELKHTKNAYVCQYCGNEEKLVFKDEEEAFNPQKRDMEGASWKESSRAVVCHCCHTSFIDMQGEALKYCAFCGSEDIKQEQVNPQIMPDALVPFRIEKEKADADFKRWAKFKWFAPFALKNPKKGGELKKVYVSAWDFNIQAQASSISDESAFNKDVSKNQLQLNCEATNRELFHEIGTFDLGQLIPFSSDYLSGVVIERYKGTLESQWSLAEDKFRRALSKELKKDSATMNIDYSQTKAKHILLPVWISSYQYRKKTRRVVINGQNGRLVGTAPVSWQKILILLGALYILGLVFQALGITTAP